MENIQSTSLKAYHGEVVPTLGQRQKVVLEALARSEGMTNVEISARIGLPINSITPRTFELLAKGLVREQKKRKCNVTGRMAIVWEVAGSETKQLSII